VDIESWYAFHPFLKIFETKLAYVLQHSAVFHYEPKLSLFSDREKSRFIHIKYMSSTQIIFMYKYFQDIKKLSFSGESLGSGLRGCFSLRVIFQGDGQ